LAAIAGVVSADIERRFGRSGRSAPAEAMFYFMGIAVVLFQFGSFLYFTLCELFWRGRTIGKRHMRLQVVKADGFALDAGSIFLRNIFRLIDQMPILWIVPVLSARGQRFGDMAAGTVVVSTAEEKLSDLRVQLLARPAAESRFRFDGTMLNRATATDIEAAERILDRWSELKDSQRNELLARAVEPLARRLGSEVPDPAQRHEFIQEFLAATYRREARRLG